MSAPDAPVAKPKPAWIWNAPTDVKQHFHALLARVRANFETVPVASRIVGLTSSYSGEGVSTVAANLAMAAAESGDQDVLLVDANFARQSLARRFQISAGPGLAEVLKSGGSVWEAIHETSAPRLSLLPAGMSPAKHAPAVQRHELTEVLSDLSERYQMVLIDLPVTNQSSGVLGWASLLDGLLLVVEAERVRWEVARRTRDLLVDADCPLLGVVLNKRPQHVPGWLYRTL